MRSTITYFVVPIAAIVIASGVLLNQGIHGGWRVPFMGSEVDADASNATMNTSTTPPTDDGGKGLPAPGASPTVAGGPGAPLADADSATAKAPDAIPAAGPLRRVNAQIQSASFTSSTDMGSTTINWDITLKPGPGGNCNIQMFLEDLNHPGSYVTVNPGINTLLNLYPNSDNSGSFTVNLPVGHYGNGKAVLFAAGTNYSVALPNIWVKGLNIAVTTTQIRVTEPEIDMDAAKCLLGPDGKEHIPFTVKEPAGTTTVSGGGYWAMVKGWGGFAQKWVDAKTFVPSGDSEDNYLVSSGVFIVAPPKPVGLFNLNAGLFDSSWKQIQWVYPGIDYEVGDWVVKADPSRYPSIADAFSKNGGLFAIGGNFGNAIASIHTADNSSANYFKLLRSLGMTYVRTNYDPDAYLSDRVYREKVDQIVQNQLAARLVPILAPQDLPTAPDSGTALQELIKVDTMVAGAYKGVPVVIDILNEPHTYTSWAQWKPDATSVLRAVKAVNPDAVTIVGFEGYSEDGRDASKDPIDPSLVSYYAMHSYHTAAADLPSRIGSLTNVILEEWHNTDPNFGKAISATPFVAESAWAWTTPGQDSIPLVKSVNGAELDLEPDGDVIESWQQAWAQGHPAN